MSEPTVSERAPSQEAARRFFDRWARFYGADPCSRWIRRGQRQALTALELDESDRLLDVGCGPGVAVCEAAPLVARATGLDLSPAMVARAQSRANGIPNVEIVEGEVVPDSRAPLLVYETGLPVRYYLPAEDVRKLRSPRHADTVRVQEEAVHLSPTRPTSPWSTGTPSSTARRSRTESASTRSAWR